LPPACSSVIDFGGRALQLVVFHDVGRNTAAVVDDRDRIVGMDYDLDVVAVAGKRFIDRIVEHLEHHVMQPGAVGRVADVHPGTLPHRVEAFEDLNAGRIVVAAVVCGLGIGLGHSRFLVSDRPRKRRRRLMSAPRVAMVTVAAVRCASASRHICSRFSPAS
jgi:hypothetical protein